MAATSTVRGSVPGAASPRSTAVDDDGAAGVPVVPERPQGRGGPRRATRRGDDGGGHRGLRHQDRAHLPVQLGEVAGERTVETHVGRLLTELDARDRAQLVVAAYEAGLVTPGG